MNERWATFDCYGTLIDWHGGLRAGLGSVWPDADPWALHRRYLEMEAAIQAGSGVPYRQVLIEGLARVANAEGLTIPPGRETTLADALPSWPPFPEVPGSLAELRARGWRIAILSNTDPDYLEASLGHIGVPVDLRVVASEIGSYKPAPGHWEVFFERSGADRSRHIHVAASLFHDIEPCARLGIPSVWIDREAEITSLPMAARLTDLTDLPDTLDRLVAA
jgi:2-haloacid dehalogenase